MIEYTYNLSSRIQQNLETIDSLRVKTLLLPLPISYELRVRWESMVRRVYWTYRIRGLDTKRDQVTKILQSAPHKRSTQIEKNIFLYKNAFEMIRFDWTGRGQPVPYTLEEGLREVFHFPQLKTDKAKDLRELFSYMFAGVDHPIVKAAISQFWHDTTGEGIHSHDAFVGRLISYVFLFKKGYAFNGSICLEEEWGSDLELYAKSQATGKTGKNLTMWLEYYTEKAVLSFEKLYESISKHEHLLPLSSKSFDLSERELAILSLLDAPSSTVTNKIVQRICRLSQITASRALSRLVGLGLLFPHGKGRSVYYTKA